MLFFYDKVYLVTFFILLIGDILKRLFLLILFIFLLIPFSVNAISIDSKSLYAMDIDSKREFYSKDSDLKRLIASTTKIMTAIVAIENSNSYDVVKVNNEILKMYGSNIYIEPNESILMIDLLYGLLLRSGNDSAIAIAEYLGGQSNFIKLMNEKAKLLGLKNTVYQNPTGLDDDTKNYSTMKDLAYIYAYSYKNNLFKEIIKTNHYVTKSTNKTYDWYNRCKFITMYDKQTGCKTGYTPDAGRLLVSSASNNDLNIVIASVNNKYDYDTHISLYDEIFKSYKNVKLLDKDDFNSKYKDDKLYIKKDFIYPLSDDELNKINFTININNDNKDIKIYFDKELIHQEKIYKTNERGSLFYRIKSLFTKFFISVIPKKL